MHLRRISPLQSVCGGGNSPASAALAQLVRALDCGSRGPLFKPGRRYHLPLHDKVNAAGQKNCVSAWKSGCTIHAQLMHILCISHLQKDEAKVKKLPLKKQVSRTE